MEIPDNVKVGKNGVWQDKTTGRFVSGGMPTTAILTPSHAQELNQRRREIKRAIIAAAANDAVERNDYILKFGDNAWIAAVSNAQAIKATTPDDPKGTDAARFLFQETGLAEPKVTEQAQQASADPVNLVLIQVINEITRGLPVSANAVDAVATDADADQ